MSDILFDASNPNWSDQGEHNRIYLRAVEQYLNNVLDIKGSLLLNDVYDAIGFPRTREGATSGWVSGTELPGYVEFTFVTYDSSKNMTLRFNHSPDILDRIWPEEKLAE